MYPNPQKKIESKDFLNLPFGNSNKLGFCFKLFIYGKMLEIQYFLAFEI